MPHFVFIMRLKIPLDLPITQVYPKLIVPGSGFNGYNRWILLQLFISNRHTCHAPLSVTGF